MVRLDSQSQIGLSRTFKMKVAGVLQFLQHRIWLDFVPTNRFCRMVKGRDILLQSFEWALPFGGIPVLSVKTGSKAEQAGIRPCDIIIEASCDISNLSLHALPQWPGVSWQLSSASRVDFDVSRMRSMDFAALFRALVGNSITLSIARSSNPIPEYAQLNSSPIPARTYFD
jgi:hypothetical protein